MISQHNTIQFALILSKITVFQFPIAVVESNYKIKKCQEFKLHTRKIVKDPRLLQPNLFTYLYFSIISISRSRSVRKFRHPFTIFYTTTYKLTWDINLKLLGRNSNLWLISLIAVYIWYPKLLLVSYLCMYVFLFCFTIR